MAASGGVGSITMLLVQPSEQEDLAMAQSVFNAITGLTGDLASTVNQQIGEKTKKIQAGTRRPRRRGLAFPRQRWRQRLSGTGRPVRPPNVRSFDYRIDPRQ